MANDEQVGNARSRARPPEQLPPPEPSAVPRPEGPPPTKAPFFIGLEQERANYVRGFEAYRDNQRRERIRLLQNLRNSRIVVYYSIGLLTPKHAELLNDFIESRPRDQRLDLFLLSPGGYAEAGHKMATLFRAHCEHFGVLIPYYAKSAATLLVLGADELVMGPASEIGPIDPRIRVEGMDVSAISIRDALDLLEGRSEGSPEKALLYAPLLERMDIRVLGEYERALKSSEQIAKDLLGKYMLKSDQAKAGESASKLALGYYTHGYVIDRVAARDDLALNVTDAPDPMWDAMWQLHKLYDAVIEESRVSGAGQIEAVFETEDLKLVSLARRRTVEGSASTTGAEEA